VTAVYLDNYCSVELAAVLLLVLTCPRMLESMLWKCSVHARVSNSLAVHAESAVWSCVGIGHASFAMLLVCNLVHLLLAAALGGSRYAR